MKGSIYLNDKMNCWGHENCQLFVASVLDDMLISNVFDEHHSYHSLPSTSFQHSNCVLSFCDFEHFHLISVKHKVTVTTKFFIMLLIYKPNKKKTPSGYEMLDIRGRLWFLKRNVKSSETHVGVGGDFQLKLGAFDLPKCRTLLMWDLRFYNKVKMLHLYWHYCSLAWAAVWLW